MKQPVIDMESCILCDICTDLAPDVFVHTDLDYIEVRMLNDYSDPMILEAVKNCPKGCITLE